MNHLRAALSILGITFVALTLIPLQWLFVRFDIGDKAYLPRLFHRAVRLIVGFKIVQTGTISPDRPLLFAINHASWLDITVFGSLTPVAYVAKQEVATWPVFGLFARLQRTVFVERTRQRTAGHRDDILQRLDAGERIGLFPKAPVAMVIVFYPSRVRFLPSRTIATMANRSPSSLSLLPMWGSMASRSAATGARPLRGMPTWTLRPTYGVSSQQVL